MEVVLNDRSRNIDSKSLSTYRDIQKLCKINGLLLTAWPALQKSIIFKVRLKYPNKTNIPLNVGHRYTTDATVVPHLIIQNCLALDQSSNLDHWGCEFYEQFTILYLITDLISFMEYWSSGMELAWIWNKEFLFFNSTFSFFSAL